MTHLILTQPLQSASVLVRRICFVAFLGTAIFPSSAGAQELPQIPPESVAVATSPLRITMEEGTMRAPGLVPLIYCPQIALDPNTPFDGSTVKPDAGWSFTAPTSNELRLNWGHTTQVWSLVDPKTVHVPWKSLSFNSAPLPQNVERQLEREGRTVPKNGYLLLQNHQYKALNYYSECNYSVFEARSAQYEEPLDKSFFEPLLSKTLSAPGKNLVLHKLPSPTTWSQLYKIELSIPPTPAQPNTVSPSKQASITLPKSMSSYVLLWYRYPFMGMTMVQPSIQYVHIMSQAGDFILHEPGVIAWSQKQIELVESFVSNLKP